jgi:FAD/FMN-containing dehydrogenase/Fe-S oxidoreductase
MSNRIYDQTSSHHNEVAGTLAARLSRESQGEVRFTEADRACYATDASIYQVTPIGVFVPKNEEDVDVALAVCRDLKVPIIGRGGGTSQCGQTVGAGLVIDFSKHLRHLTDLDLENGIATVQSGMVLDHLNAQLKQHKLWYPVDVSTSAQATLGGMAGNNSCGSRSIAYGNMVHNVVGIDAWLANGDCLHWGQLDAPNTSPKARELGLWLRGLAEDLRPELEANWPKVLRRVAGYNLDLFMPQSVRPYTADGSVNLAHLLVGSEGTLSLTRSLNLKLSGLPAHKVLGIVNFPTFYQAMDAAQHIVKLDQNRDLMAVELVDRTMIDLALQNPAFAPTMRTALSGDPAAILLVEFAGADLGSLKAQLSRLEALMGDLKLPGSVVCMTDPSAQRNLWEVRKAGLNIMMSLRGDGKPVSFIEDCAVPLENLAEYTSALTEVFQRHGSRGTWYAHASVGTLHVRPILDMRKDGAKKMREIAEEASALVKQFKGAYSGEHGDGLCRGEWIEWQFGPRIQEALVAIKQKLDPEGLLCPQRIVNPPKMDDLSLMRYSPSYQVIPIKPALNWSAWDVQNEAATEKITAPGTGGDPANGLAKAVEMCNNNGTCRKFDAGTMCPSYRITRDEQHVTRGRANILRMAMSNQLPTENGEIQGIGHPAVKAAMDLCVSCKGCKRECPTGVDMARMKLEVLNHHQKMHGLTLRQRLISYLPNYAATASQFAPILNLRDKISGLAKLSEMLLDLSSERNLPKWRRKHFFNQPQEIVSKEAVLAADKPVVLFVDTFTGYLESDIAQAAVRVLNRAGYAVHVATRAPSDNAPHLCCGRTFLASGLLELAREKMADLIVHLAPFAEAGIPVVGLEPSCLLTLRDEALAMNLGEQAIRVAENAVLFEEFLEQAMASGDLDLLRAQLTDARQPFLVHAHCHQKAMGADKSIAKVLGMIPNADVEMIESSCCGMAGAFGYEVEHITASRQMAEASLLPTIRKRPDSLVIADGTSCRHQIQDHDTARAHHVATVIDRHLSHAP